MVTSLSRPIKYGLENLSHHLVILYHQLQTASNVLHVVSKVSDSIIIVQNDFWSNKNLWKISDNTSWYNGEYNTWFSSHYGALCLRLLEWDTKRKRGQ
jgi:hypothetical protein